MRAYDTSKERQAWRISQVGHARLKSLIFVNIKKGNESPEITYSSNQGLRSNRLGLVHAQKRRQGVNLADFECSIPSTISVFSSNNH